MRIVEVNEKIIKKLRNDKLLEEMKSLEFCKFLVIEEEEGKIIGASGIGGMVNNHSIIINKEKQGRGLGLGLFKKNIDEAKQRGYNYITSSRNPKNRGMKRLHEICNFKPLLRINYSPGVISEAHMLPLNKKGHIIYKLMRFFNTKFGLNVLVLLLKLLKPKFENALTLSTEDYKEPNLKYIVSHFEKY